MKRTVTLLLILAMLFSMAPWSLTVEAVAAADNTDVIEPTVENYTATDCIREKLLLDTTDLIVGNINTYSGSTVQAESASFVSRSDGVWLWPMPTYTMSDWAGCNGNSSCYFHPGDAHGGCAAPSHSTWDGLGHNGFDAAASIGTPVYAMADGTAYVRYENARGYYVVVEHPIGKDVNGNSWSYYTYYQHLSEFAVADGTPVSAGTTIGKTGNSGVSVGPHLHVGMVLGKSGCYDSIYALECEGWVTTSGFDEGRILTNPALNSPAGNPIYTDGCEANVRMHAGSVMYTLNKAEVNIGFGDSVPVCAYDVATGGTNSVYVRGWAYDPDTPNESVRIQVYMDGVCIGSGVANTLREDVNAVYGCGNNHGFDITLPVTVTETGTHSIEVYALNTNASGDNKYLGHKDVTITAHTHSYTDSVTKEATCTQAGIKTYTCESCSNTYTEEISATGHDYNAEVIGSTCTTVGQTVYTCSKCGDSYIDTSVGWSEWSTEYPTGIPENLIQQKTQYSTLEKEYTTATSDTLDGWTNYGTTYGEWGTTQTTTTKPQESDTLQITNTVQTGWGYYHWCNYYYNGGNNWNVDSIAYGGPCYLHGYTSTFALPAVSFQDQGGQQGYGGTGSGASPCGYNFYVWFRNTDTDVYTYSYQTRSVTNQFYKWSDEWSDWSDEEVTGNENCQVKTQTVYRYAQGALGHSFTNYISDNNATVEADGTKTAKCDRCDATDTVADTGSKLLGGKCGENLTWTLDSEGTLTISGTGDMNYFLYEENPWSNYKDNIIKVTVNEGVTSIYCHAFDICANLTDMYLPATMTRIDMHAYAGPSTYFCGAPKLNGIWVAEGNPAYFSDEYGVLFDGVNHRLMRAPSTLCGEYTVPAGISEIGFGAFCETKGITAVTLPDSLKKLGWYAFDGCSELESINLENLTQIGGWALSGCKKLENVTLSDGLEIVDEAVFMDCEGLTSITIPASVTTIDLFGFYRCYNLKDVYYGGTQAQWSSITLLGEQEAETQEEYRCLLNATIHYNSTGVVEIIDSGTCGANVIWALSNDGTLTISGSGAMRNYDEGGAPWYQYADSINKAVFAPGVTTVGDCVFFGCENLTQVILPEGITKIGWYAFRGCYALASVNIPDSVTFIGEQAFGWCYALESVNIPAGLTSIGYDAFICCKSITGIWVDQENTVYSSDEDGVLYNKDKTHLIRASLSIDSDYVIADTVKTIEMSAFSYCTKLTSIIIPSSITGIGDNVFMYCTNLKSVTIPVSVTIIWNRAFTFCDSLTDVYYEGTKTQWSNIQMGIYNDQLEDATFHYECYKPVAIVKQPVTAGGVLGDVVTVTVAAKGTGLTYQWYYKDKNATEFTLNADFTGENYSAALDENSDGREVYCVITDWLGNRVTTDTVSMKIVVPVYISQQLESVAVPYGETATITFEAQGEGLRYEWYYKDVGSKNFLLTASFTGNSYSAVVNKYRAGRQIYCVVTDQYGFSVTTETVTLSVAEKPVLAITKQPVSVTVAEGETATVTFTAEGEGLTYKWYYKNKGATKFTATATFKGDTYTAQMNSSRTGREIYCVVSDKYGNSVQTDTVTLNMLSKSVVKITQQPVSVYVTEGETAVVNFTAEGEGLTYKWYYKNLGATKFTATATFKGDTYTAQMNSSRTGRQIYCVVTDKYGNSVQTDTVTLFMLTGVRITRQPVSVEAEAGEMATVSFTAVGDGLTYQWYYRNKGASKFTATATFKGNTYSAEMDFSRAGREVYCVVTDQYGNSVQTDTVTLDLANKPPVFISWQPVSVAVAGGETAKVSFLAQGEGLTYKWYYKDKGVSKFSLTTTFTGNEYSAVMNSYRDGRQVYCVVTDKYGNSVTTDTVTLSRMTPLAITKQPESVVVASGATATVSFTATGDGLTYKWYYKDVGVKKFSLTTTFTGTEYSAVINSYRDGRQVYCVVTDRYGNSVTTDIVTLSREVK